MQTGKLDKRIKLFSPVTSNVAGEVKQSYQLVGGEVWARVISPRGSESFEAARLQTRETIRVLIRYRTDIQSSWEIEYNGRRYNVTAVDDSERRKGNLWFTAETKGAR